MHIAKLDVWCTLHLRCYFDRLSVHLDLVVYSSSSPILSLPLPRRLHLRQLRTMTTKATVNAPRLHRRGLPSTYSAGFLSPSQTQPFSGTFPHNTTTTTTKPREEETEETRKRVIRWAPPAYHAIVQNLLFSLPARHWSH